MYNDKWDRINNIFITYVEPFLEYINNHVLVEEQKVNINAAAY